MKNTSHYCKNEFLSLITAFLLFSTLTIQAGQVQVLNTASTIGNNGLRVTAGKACIINNLVIPAGSITTNQVACDTIATTGVSAVTNSASFITHDSITLNPGFSVALGISFDATIDPFVDIPFAFVENGSPNTEVSYNARFDLNLDNLNLVTAEDIEHFTAFAADDSVQFKLSLRLIGGTNHLVLIYRNGGILVEHGTTIALPAGSNAILVHWKSGNGDGEYQVTLNKNSPIGPTNIANNTSRIDSIRWGLVEGSLASTITGFIDLDDFFSFR